MGITYLGIMDMPEGADDLFENIVTESPFGLSFFQVNTYRDDLNIISIQRYDGSKIVDSLCRKLKSEGLDAAITSNELVEHNVLNLEKIEESVI